MAHDEATRRRLEAIDRAVEREAVRHRRSVRRFWLLLLVPVIVAGWMLWATTLSEPMAVAPVGDSEMLQVLQDRVDRATGLAEETSQRVERLDTEQEELRRAVERAPVMSGNPSDEVNELRERVRTLEGRLRQRDEDFERINARLGTLERQSEETRTLLLREPVRPEGARIR